MFDFIKYIKEENGKFCVYSEDGKKLGEHDTKAAALKQLRAIEANKCLDRVKGLHGMGYAKHLAGAGEPDLRSISSLLRRDRGPEASESLAIAVMIEELDKMVEVS